MFASLSMLLVSANNASAQAAAGGQDAAAGAKQQYTMPEYNAEQACGNDPQPASKVKCLDDFVSKYSTSYLLKFVYPMYVQTYSQLKNWAKVIEYADKTVALADKMGPAEMGANEKYGALYARAFAFNNLAAADQAAQAKGAVAAAEAGLKLVPDLKKPDSLDDKAFDEQKKQATIYLNGTAAQASLGIKDYPTAIKYYKAVLAINPDEAITDYNLGRAYLASTPPDTMSGFWYIARAITSKNATQQQSTQLKTYLRKLVVNYQQAGCDSLIDAEFNELLQLAGSSAEMPASYKIPSSTDLSAAQKDMTIASVIADLKAGGDKAKVTWLASCGLEFPDVPGKLIEVTAGAAATDPVVLKLAFVTNQSEFDAATTPNMEVKVVGQPEAGKLEKDSAPRFTGTLVSYDPDPAFMLHWDKAKVNAEDLPKEKEAPKKAPVRRPAAKKPAR
jgi:tetratricopeptide (TPR) repeat protein